MLIYNRGTEAMPVTDKEITLINNVSVCGSAFSTSVSPLKNVALARMNQNISYNENMRRNSSGGVNPSRNRSELFVPNINLNKRLFQNGLSRSVFSEKCQKNFSSHEIIENGRVPGSISPVSTVKSEVIFHQANDEKVECEKLQDDNSLESFSDAIKKECKALGRDSKCLWRQSALLWGENVIPESHRSSWTCPSDNGTVSTTEGDADSRIWDTATSATTEEDDTPSEGAVMKRYSSESPSRNPVVRHCSSTTTEEDYSTCQADDFKRLSIDANVRKVVVRDGTPIISNLELNDETSEEGSACSEKACEEDTAAFLEKTSQLEHSVLDYLCSPTSVLRDNGTRETVTIDFEFWDLQSEIESHKDVVASLNATGQKLLGTLENQDEAMMLHRRLEEMNTRWNTLKHRSIAIRSRLEGNTESWNSLLLSLRELIEWVIRKDTELTAMGPPSGDIATLTKLESDLVSFRRVLDEKQPVVESNLKSGRQLIASEPPLSDTSDSEAGRDLDGDARRHGEESARELTRSVRREVAKLSEKWAALRERAAAMATNISLANKKLGVLQKTLEEVDGRLDVAEGTVSNWGPVPQDSNLAEQHVHNVTKFREGLSDLQRGVDDVNDQAARFSAHNIPLAADTSTRLHRLNARWKQVEGIVNDRWRQVAGRSRDVTPLTPAQLGSSVSHPWERAVANNKVPYYINHAQETTYWDHPEMMSLLDELADLNHIKFSAYRTAAKLRALQKKLALDQATLQLVTDVFDEHGLRGQNDRLIEVSDMVVVLSTLYCRIASDRPDVNTSLTTDLCLNWLLNVYDSQRTGQMRVLSFRVGLVCLCKGHLEEKYRYVFRLIADPNRLVDQRKLGLLLHDCVQVPRQLGEVAAFGGSNIEPSVRSCFTKAGKDRETIEAVHFLSWVQQEPQSLVWLAVLHRVAASEHIQHQVKCNICKTCPIVGLRYRCLKCIGFDMCQKCFFEGRSSKSHKITHPMHEYCTATTAGDEMKDFTKALKNKFKSKRSLQKHTKKGYLPVQTVLEGDPLESPSPSPQHGVSSQDMHNRLEQYASRLAEVELRTNSNSTPDSEDEHGLIAQYCQSLSSGDGAALPVPRSPLQVMAAVDADQKDELEQMIRELEEENQALQAEYEQLRLQQEPSDSPQSSGGSPLRSEAEMLAEARLLRQHKGRLEARMTILEQHNQQLEAQLHRLRQLLQQNGGSSMNKSGTLQTKSVTASQLATDSPAKVNGHSGQGDLERAVGSLVATVTHDQERDSRNGSRQASEGREDEPFPVPQLDHEIEQYDNNPMPAEKDR